MLGHAERNVVELAPRHHAIDHADLTRATGGHAIDAEIDDLLGDLWARDPRQQHRDDAGAEFQLRLTEERVFRADGDVTGERELAGAGETRAAYRRDGRKRAVPEAHDGVEILAQH